jgi:hypothetical protein
MTQLPLHLKKWDIFILSGIIITVGLFGYIRSIEVQQDTELLLQNQQYFKTSEVQHDQATRLIIVNEQLIIDALRNGNQIGNQTQQIYNYLLGNQSNGTEPKPIPYNVTLYIINATK